MESVLSDLTKPVAIMCFSSGTGGMERSAVRLARFLSSITTVVLVCKQGSFIESLYREECGSYKCETINFISRILSPAMMIRAGIIIQDYNISNVIFFGASELKSLYFSFLRKNINLIVWHGTTKSRAKRDFLHRLVYSGVNYHVALSEHLIRNVKNIVPVSPGVKYKVIRPSFDFDVNLGCRKSQDHDVINILHVGRVANGKGQVDAVKACGVLKKKGINFRLVFVGTADGSGYIRDVENSIKASGLESNVLMAGYVENVNSFLEQADILLFPSSGEGMPNAFIEALHYDIVCIAYDNTVFPEFIDMGFHVHLAANGNIAELSDLLLYAVNNLDAEKEKSNRNVELSRKYFQKDREIKEWLEILV